MSVYDYKARKLDGAEVSLADYRGKVLLIVNTASKCGFTPQYEGLEELYRRRRGQGFEVLGFPCNQFGAQEPLGEAEIGEFCKTSYGVDFPMFAKIEVNGPKADPLYVYLKKAKPGLLGSEGVKWNFTKFLIDRAGEPVERFAPTTKPSEIEPKIDALLAAGRVASA